MHVGVITCLCTPCTELQSVLSGRLVLCVWQGKKKGKGKKGGKGKKAKPLPGAKACANMDVDHMLSVLIENKIVNNVRARSVSELRGTFNYLGSAYQVCGWCECFWCVDVADA